MKTEPKRKSLPLFGIPRLRPFLRTYRVILVIMVITGLAGSAVDIVIPLFQKYALDTFAVAGALATLLPFIAAYVFTLLFQLAVNFTSTYLVSKVEQSVDRDLRAISFNHLQTLSFSYFNQNSVGYIHARIMSDTSRIGELVSWSLMDGIWHISYIVGAAGVMLSINYRLALILIAIIPVTAVFIGLFQGKLTALNRRTREINSRITGNYNEGITGARTIKSLVIEDKMANDFREETSRMKKISVRTTHYNGLFGATITFASSIGIALVLWRGGIITLADVKMVGTLSVFMSYATGIIEPIRWIAAAISALVAGQVNIERLTDLINTPSDVTDTPEVVEKYGDTFTAKRENWEELGGEITFEDVSFKYPDGEEYILEHFDLTIPKGSNVAIVGETGAGKSTLVNLVCRFYEPTAGRVLIDGRDARERSQLWLHSNIGYVLQTPHLFSGTILDNLRYANPDASIAEVEDALRSVCADGVVAKLEDGIYADVGEGGDMLSTGEKQLLSFARALLAAPKILVLDEATASVDTITEQKIQLAITKIIEGRTSIMIAHRLSTIRNADIILVVDNGRIVERGTHDELLASRGAYSGLYRRQYEFEATKALLDN